MPDLDDPAEVHHRHPVGDVPRQPEVVADHERGQAELVAQAQEQLQDLAAHRRVERRHRLVGDEDLRPQREGAGDDHPLLLSAGELVGVAVEELSPAVACPPAPAPRRRAGSGPPAARGAASPSATASWTFCRGLRAPSDPAARAGRDGGSRAAPERVRRSGSPSYRISPRFGSISPTSARASVDLPHPDSPIRASTSPRRERQVDAVDGARRPAARGAAGTDTDRSRASRTGAPGLVGDRQP